MIDSRIKAVYSMFRRDEHGKAWPIVSELLNEDPDNAQALYLAGNILRSQGHTGMALQMFRRALALDQKQPNIWMHFGACLHDTHQYAQAREAFHWVRKACTGDPMPLANIAATYVQEGKAKESIEWADKALAIDPTHRIGGVAKSFGCLALGRWSEGWKYAESLYGDTLSIRVYTEHDEPVWDGTPGQTVVVQADQGLGDMIMFAQCLKPMIRDCKKVIIETNKRLMGMFRRNFPEADVYGTLKEEKDLEWPNRYDIDAHIHISWLGRYYRTVDEDFPRQPYLTPDAERCAQWREWLQQFPRPWVGLAWRGGIPQTNVRERSMKLETLKPILEAGGTLISLAYQDVGGEIARWNIANRQQVIVPPLNNAGDYDQTIALIAELDHVVTVTTTVAHVCGALGKRASVLVNRIPAWRYCYLPDSVIWYPENSLTLYRQKPGEQDWTHAVSRLARNYEAFVVPLAA